ncbi:MAG: aminoglycoside phosphotransferase family protein [Alphaproteobacteria bacterium]|nr:aminoglycoside phosphotransferase family protein [Alphaproteobacteria bacterium]
MDDRSTAIAAVDIASTSPPNTWRKLSGGVSHDIFLVPFSGSQAVAKFFKSGINDFTRFRCESRALETLGGRLSPRLLACSRRRLSIVQEYVTGTALTDKEFGEAAWLSALSTSLARHRPALRPFTFLFDMKSISYRNDVASILSEKEMTMSRSLVRDFRSFDPRYRPCHLDLSHSNIIKTHPGDYVFIDWEYSCVAPQETELAFMFAVDDVGEARREHFIKRFEDVIGGSLNKDLLAILESLRVLFWLAWNCSKENVPDAERDRWIAYYRSKLSDLKT